MNDAFEISPHTHSLTHSECAFFERGIWNSPCHCIAFPETSIPFTGAIQLLGITRNLTSATYVGSIITSPLTYHIYTPASDFLTQPLLISP